MALESAVCPKLDIRIRKHDDGRSQYPEQAAPQHRAEICEPLFDLRPKRPFVEPARPKHEWISRNNTKCASDQKGVIGGLHGIRRGFEIEIKPGDYPRPGAGVEGCRITNGRQVHTQPFSFSTRTVDAGFLASAAAGRIGLGEKLPEQFGQISPSTSVAHSVQNVHS